MKRFLIAAAALGLAALPVEAATVDQSYLPTGNAAALTIDSVTTARGQSFTVGLDGLLTGVRVNVSDKGNFDNAPDATLTVSIFDVSGGAIDTAGGALLSGALGRTLGSTSFNDFKLAEVLFSSSLAVSVGDTLAIVLDGVSAGQNDGFFWASGGDAAGYAGGQPFSGSTLASATFNDFQFETLVDTTSTTTPIPLPAGLPLLLSALGIGALLKRRRRPAA